MKRTSALILSIIILLTLNACGKTPDSSVSPNYPGASNDTFHAETMPGLGKNPKNDFSERTEQNDNDEDIVTAASSTPPAPETTPPPAPTLEPTPTAAVPQPAQATTVETTPALIYTSTPEPATTPTPQPTPTSVPEPSPSPELEPNSLNISVTVGGSVFTVKLYDNDTARAFVALLPMTLNMSELNSNEKYYYLPEKLPADSQQIGSIKAGDLMLYGSDCLVLFYESFSTSYSYTKIGYFEDVSGLADASGHGSVQVTFAISE